MNLGNTINTRASVNVEVTNPESPFGGVLIVNAASSESDGSEEAVLASDFLTLTDTPDTYAGQAGKFVRVKADESGLEFVTVTAGGGELPGTGSGRVTTTGDSRVTTDGDTRVVTSSSSMTRITSFSDTRVTLGGDIRIT